MELPHASEIRTLRAFIDRAAQARAQLSLVESTLMALAIGHGESVAAVVDQLRTDWPDLDLSGDHLTALGKARLGLGRAVALGERAGRELHPIMERQWQELEKEDWASVRGELAELIDRRASASASFGPVEGMIAGLGPTIGALDERLPSIVSDLRSEDPIAVARGMLLLRALLDALEPPLARIGLSGSIPRPDKSTWDATEVLRQVAQLRSDLEQALTRLHHERVKLKRELDAVEASLRSRTG